MGEWMYSSTIVDPDSRWRRVVASCLVTLTPGKGPPPRYLFERELGGPFLDAMEKRNILSLPEIEPRSSSPVAIRLSCSRLSLNQSSKTIIDVIRIIRYKD
jgi:hypothetical protein